MANDLNARRSGKMREIKDARGWMMEAETEQKGLIAAAVNGWKIAQEKIPDPDIQSLLLDDINIVLRYDDPDQKSGMTQVCLTGRNAKPELPEAADLVTEMTLFKHPFRDEIRAQNGFEN